MGWGQYAGFGNEITYDSAVARTEFTRVNSDWTVDDERPRDAVVFLEDRDPTTHFDGVRRATFGGSMPLVYDGLELLLKHCLGDVTVTGTGPYTHTFNVDSKPYTRATSPLVGLTVETFADLPDSGLGAFLISGGRIRSWSLKFERGNETTLTVDGVGATFVQAAKTGAPTFPTYGGASGVYVLPTQCVLTIDGDGKAEGVEVRSFEIQCANALRDDNAFLGESVIDTPNAAGRREITGTIDLNWDKTQYDKFQSGTAAAILLTATGPGNHSMTVRCENSQFTGRPPGLQEGEDIDMSLSFRAFDDATYGAVQVVTVNDTA